MPFHEQLFSNPYCWSEAYIKAEPLWYKTGQRVPGRTTETGAQRFSSVTVGQDRLARGTCKQLSPTRVYEEAHLS